MPRELWKGAIQFGLVHIPVSLFPGEQSEELSFTMLDRRDLQPVGYKRFNKTTVPSSTNPRSRPAARRPMRSTRRWRSRGCATNQAITAIGSPSITPRTGWPAPRPKS